MFISYSPCNFLYLTHLTKNVYFILSIQNYIYVHLKKIIIMLIHGFSLCVCLYTAVINSQALNVFVLSPWYLHIEKSTQLAALPWLPNFSEYLYCHSLYLLLYLLIRLAKEKEKKKGKKRVFHPYFCDA